MPVTAPDATGPMDEDETSTMDEDRDCLICGGDGYLYGEDMGDPLWYDDDEVLACYSCHGSGLRKDMTIW